MPNTNSSLTKKNANAWSVRITLLVLCLAFTSVSATAGEVVLLHADFNDKTVGAPIGTGGAAQGEPFSIDPDVEAVVVGPGPYTSNSLRFNNTSTMSTRYTRFQFIDDQEVTTGRLQITVKLRPSTHNNHRMFVREAFGSTSSFTFIFLDSSGVISLTDAGMTALTAIGNYTANEIIKLDFVYELSAGSYSVLINGNVVVVDRAHGVNNGRGIGSILFGSPTNSDDLFIDDIEVTYLSEEMFADGFE